VSSTDPWPEKWTPTHASKGRLHQGVAGIVVAKKNRCIRIGAPSQGSIALRGGSSELAGTISGTIEGAAGGRASRDVVYT